MSAVVVSGAVRRRHAGPRVRAAARGASISLVVVVLLAPIVWMVLAALKTNIQINDPSQTFLFRPTLTNFRNVFTVADFLPFMKNSLVVGVVSTVVALVLGVPAAYSLSRFSMRTLTTVVMFGRIMPGISLLVPWFYIFSRLGLVGGYTPLVLSHMFVSLPLIVYIMIAFFDQLPIELEEQGLVDGLTPIGSFARIAVPLSAPGMATGAILALVFSWNNFMFSLVLASNATRTLPVSLFNFIAYASVDWGGLMAASFVVTAPIMLLALLTQRYIVAGFTAGAVKG